MHYIPIFSRSFFQKYLHLLYNLKIAARRKNILIVSTASHHSTYCMLASSQLSPTFASTPEAEDVIIVIKTYPFYWMRLKTCPATGPCTPHWHDAFLLSHPFEVLSLTLASLFLRGLIIHNNLFMWMSSLFKPLTAGAAYIRAIIFY